MVSAFNLEKEHWDTEIENWILVSSLSTQNGEQILGMLGSCSDLSITFLPN